MPKATLLYPYELKIAGVINELATKLMEGYDHNEANTFVIYLNDSNEFECTRFDEDDAYFETTDRLKEEGVSFFFFDHFDPHCYAYLTWNCISQSLMEELHGSAFEVSDFMSMKTKEKGSYRDSGSVMLG